MEEVGVVTSITGPLATVLVQKKSACDHCTAGTCNVTGEGANLEALNEAQARVGQRVKVSLRPYTYLKGSLILYGLPALALIVGAVAGKELAGAFLPGTDEELAAAVAAFGLFGLSFLLVKVWSSRAEKNVRYRPVIEEILEEQTT
jgi:sigma-E factor negative regulatory protein RseC